MWVKLESMNVVVVNLASYMWEAKRFFFLLIDAQVFPLINIITRQLKCLDQVSK